MKQLWIIVFTIFFMLGLLFIGKICNAPEQSLNNQDQSVEIEQEVLTVYVTFSDVPLEKRARLKDEIRNIVADINKKVEMKLKQREEKILRFWEYEQELKKLKVTFKKKPGDVMNRTLVIQPGEEISYQLQSMAGLTIQLEPLRIERRKK